MKTARRVILWAGWEKDCVTRQTRAMWNKGAIGLTGALSKRLAEAILAADKSEVFLTFLDKLPTYSRRQTFAAHGVVSGALIFLQSYAYDPQARSEAMRAEFCPRFAVGLGLTPGKVRYFALSKDINL